MIKNLQKIVTMKYDTIVFFLHSLVVLFPLLLLVLFIIIPFDAVQAIDNRISSF